MSNYIILKKAETDTALVSVCNDGIVRVLFKKNAEINPSNVKENIDAYNALVDGEYYTYLFYTEDDFVVYTSEGLKYAGDHSKTGFPKICSAVVVKPLAHKIIANFYIRLHSSKDLPIKVFNKLHEAESWCIAEYQKYQNKRILKA